MNGSLRLKLIWITVGIVGLAGLSLMSLIVWSWVTDFASPKIKPSSTATLFIFPPTWTATMEGKETVQIQRQVTEPFPTATRAKLIMPTLPGSLYLEMATSTPVILPTRMDTPTLIHLIIHSPTPTPTFSSYKPSQSETP